MTENAFRRPRGDAPAPPPSYEEHIPVKIGKAADAVGDVARLILGDTHGLGLTDFRILAYLSERPSASLADVSRDLDIDKAWISRLAQALGTRNYIRKQRDPSDSRAVLASLTDEGRAAHESALSRVNRFYGRIMAGIDEELAADLIARLDANLREIAADLRSKGAGGDTPQGPRPK